MLGGIGGGGVEGYVEGLFWVVNRGWWHSGLGSGDTSVSVVEYSYSYSESESESTFALLVVSIIWQEWLMVCLNWGASREFFVGESAAPWRQRVS